MDHLLTNVPLKKKGLTNTISNHVILDTESVWGLLKTFPAVIYYVGISYEMTNQPELVKQSSSCMKEQVKLEN